jgi:hypothetical protein
LPSPTAPPTNMSEFRQINKLASFLRKTFDMLSNPGNSDCVCWTAGGDGFCIKNVAKFTERVLPRYFRHKNYPSFVRQLGMYEFTKQGDTLPTFTHPNFQRGNRALLREIHRSRRETQRPGMTQDDYQRLLTRVKSLQQEHRAFDQVVEQLRGENHQITTRNQDLLSEIGSLRAREQQLETLLCVFSDRLHYGDPRDSTDGGSGQDEGSKSYISN